MSPASKSKSKDKKAMKETTKSSSKPSGHVNVNISSGIPASGYNPLLGTFHTFETPPVASATTLNANGRFRDINDMEDHSGSLNGTGVEYDSVSNTGSWSGESEDPKEKGSHPSRQESVPGADNDKREKIRLKNERKHQRQKERRAQELHEKCSGYLMSRKLEVLAQQLVAMGFSQERSTMALILNEGKVEESVAWLFEGGEEDKRVDCNLGGGGTLKIDISEELAKITDMEKRYKVSKQEVERAIVACEGDLDKAEETLKAQNQKPPSPEENGDPPTVAITRVQIQQKRDAKDFNYTKAPVTTSGFSMDLATKHVQLLKKIPPKPDWTKLQQIAPSVDKRWPNASPNAPSVSYSTSPLQVSPPFSMTEAQYLAVENELKNLQLGSVREPVAMQQSQSTNVSSSLPGTAMGWYPSDVETVKSNVVLPRVSASRSLSPNGVSSNPMYNQPQQQFIMPTSSSLGSQSTSRVKGSWNRSVPSLSPASSLGLFSRLGANGSSAAVDWNTGSSILQLDYTNVDWSLDLGLLTSRSNGWSTGANYTSNNRYDLFSYGVGAKSAMRTVISNGNVGSIAGMQEGVASMELGGGGSREWTSPFEERDLFNLSRQFVSSPTL